MRQPGALPADFVMTNPPFDKDKVDKERTLSVEGEATMPKMRNRGPSPEETLRILDKLISRKLLDEKKFKEMHHFTRKGKRGGSLARFRSYCRQHKSFNSDSENDNLARDLQKLLDDHGAWARAGWCRALGMMYAGVTFKISLSRWFESTC